MAEHEVTEAMVEAALLATFDDAEAFDDEDRLLMRSAISAALAARTTDASAARDAAVLRRMPPFGPMLKSIATLGLDCTFDGKPMRDAIADAIAWCDVDLPQMAGADADARDAARYRWLRERHRNPYVQISVPPYGTGIISGEECDEVIDKRMLASSPQQRAGDGG